MKKIILFTVLLVVGAWVQAQNYADSKPISISLIAENVPIHKLPPEVFIKNYVEKRIGEWQTKGEYEKTTDWQKRVNDQTRKAKASQLQAEAEMNYKEAFAKNINWKQFSISTYDSDNETFLVSSTDFGQFALAVPIASAKSFKENFNQVTSNTPKFAIGKDKLHLLALNFYNPVQKKTFTYNSSDATLYEIVNIDYNFKDLNIDVNDQTVTNNTNVGKKTVSTATPDVDVNIPQTGKIQNATFAVIIANENYLREVEVDYALNDGKVFKEYCIKTLGIPEKNIHFASNATFGTMKSEIKWISDVADAYKGQAKLIFYYAGHGMPNESTKEAYLLPTDGFSSDYETAIRLEDLYQKLTQYETKNVTVFLDACFSGSVRDNGMLANARGLVIKPKPTLAVSNMVVFSATTDDETAYPYHDMQHGLFTYFLLKKIKETKGNTTYEQLSDYISQNVKQQSVVVNNKSQSPQIIVGSKISDTWKNFKLIE